jgi:hypothetical protein
LARARIERDFVAILMESPLYFTIPLKRRLEFLRFISQVYGHGKGDQIKRFWP